MTPVLQMDTGAPRRYRRDVHREQWRGNEVRCAGAFEWKRREQEAIEAQMNGAALLYGMGDGLGACGVQF